MAYIPNDWLKDKKNDEKVHEIFDKYYSSDINIEREKAINELEEIGETTIIEKLKSNKMRV